MPGCICNECTNYGEETGCTSALDLRFDNITSTSLTLSWSGSSNAVSFNVEYKQTVSATWLLLPAVTTNSVTITGLTADTAYDFRVNTVCTGTACMSLTHRTKTLEQ